METEINSYLLLEAKLDTPVLIDSVFSSGDLKEVNHDYHITIASTNDYLDRDDLRKNIDFSYMDLLNEQKDEELYSIPIFDLFDLSSFDNNDSKYIVLRMKDNNSVWSDMVRDVNKKISKTYSITSNFGTYKPHITLATLYSTAEKDYLQSYELNSILKDSTVHFEDFIVSYELGNSGKFKQMSITTNNPVDRFFRIRDLDNE